MQPWARVRQLFRHSAAVQSEDRERDHRARQQGQRRAAWFTRAERDVMSGIERALTKRVAELAHLGVSVLVDSKRSGPPSSSFGGSTRCLRATFAGQAVLVYSVRSAVDLVVHWSWVVPSSRPRFPRILSVPGVRVQPASRAAWSLVALDPTRGFVPTSLDDLACHLLCMLAQAATRGRITQRTL